MAARDHAALRADVASAGRRLAAAGLVARTSGNVSARAGDVVAITPTGAELASVRPEEIALIGLTDGELRDGPLAPTSEKDLHLGVYRAHDAGAVVHTHPPVATALSCVLDEVPVVHYEMLLLGGAVPVAPYRTFGTPELAETVVEALAGHAAALMAHHGAITHAEDLAGAVRRAELLEWVCELYWRAAALGTPRTLDAAAQAAVVSTAVARNYGSTQAASGE